MSVLHSVSVRTNGTVTESCVSDCLGHINRHSGVLRCGCGGYWRRVKQEHVVMVVNVGSVLCRSALVGLGLLISNGAYSMPFCGGLCAPAAMPPLYVMPPALPIKRVTPEPRPHVHSWDRVAAEIAAEKRDKRLTIEPLDALLQGGSS